MGPPPSSGPLELDNLPELRTTMEPIRDAVPQRSLTTTPASTTAGHAPDMLEPETPQSHETPHARVQNSRTTDCGLKLNWDM